MFNHLNLQTGRNFHFDRAIFGKIAFGYGETVILNHFFDLRLLFIREAEGVAENCLHFGAAGIGKCVRCSRTICPDESGDAQEYPSEVTDDGNQYVLQPGGIYLSKDLSSRGTGGLSVVAGAPYPLFAQDRAGRGPFYAGNTVCIAAMTGGMVLFTEGVEKRFHLFFAPYREGIRDEAAALVLEKALRFAPYGGVNIAHCVIKFSKNPLYSQSETKNKPMTYQYRVTLKGIKGFYRVYTVGAANSLYMFHKQLRADLEFPLDQPILFKAFDATGAVVARYALIDLGFKTVDQVSINDTVAAGITSFEYFYDIASRKSVIITFEGESDSTEPVPTVIESKGPLPIEFENGYVAFEDLPPEHRHLPGESSGRGDEDDEDDDEEDDEEDDEDEEDEDREEEELVYDGKED